MNLRKITKILDDFREDRFGQPIGNGDTHVEYWVFDFTDYPQVTSNVQESSTTESVYVRYYNEENKKSITVRFSDHINNAVRLGDQLDGRRTAKDEVLYHLGIKDRIYVPKYVPWINHENASQKKVRNGEYALIDKDLEDLYALGIGADLSDYTGKVTKDGKWRIMSEVVGKADRGGTYKYIENK